MKKAILLLLMTLSLQPLWGQVRGIDPNLPLLIAIYTQRADTLYRQQAKMQSLEGTGHIWIRQEVEAVKELQQEFDQYISLFRDIVCFAAQTYGFYYEVGHIVGNMNRLTDLIGKAPTNALAVALHNRRNDIYVDIILRSTGIIRNIRDICFQGKMTQAQRIELVMGIRPQLQAINSRLVLLNKLIRHTTLADVWREVQRGAIDHRLTKDEIILQSLTDWKANAKKTK